MKRRTTVDIETGEVLEYMRPTSGLSSFESSAQLDRPRSLYTILYYAKEDPGAEDYIKDKREIAKYRRVAAQLNYVALAILSLHMR